MYRIDFLEDCNSWPLPLFDSRIKSYGFLWGGNLKFKYDDSSIVTFRLLPTHALYDRLNKGKQEIIIRESEDDYGLDNYENIIYRGRLMKIKEEYTADGGRYKEITCEGILNTLMDWVVNQAFSPASASLSDIFRALNTGIHVYSAWPGTYFDAYHLEFKINAHSDFIQGPAPSEWGYIAVDGTSRYGDNALGALKTILKDVNAFLKERHYVVYDMGNFRLKTDVSAEIKYPGGGVTGKNTRLMLGKHVIKLTVETDYSKIANDVALDGDEGKSSGIWDTVSMTAHGPRFYYKRDRIYTVQASLNRYVTDILERYKDPETGAKVEVISLLEGETKQKDIKVGGLMEIVDPHYNRIYWGFITEVDYNLNSPYEKTVYLDKPSANLWKGSM